VSGSPSSPVADFENVFRDFFPRLRGFFRSHGFSSDDAEDLSQKTLWNVYRAWEQFRGEGSLAGWIYAAGRNVARDEWRRRGRAAKAELPSEEIADPAVDAEESVRAKQMSERAAAALAALPVRMRACLLLRVQEELSYREIGRRLGISEATVKVQIWMARKKLRKGMAES